MDFHHRKLHNQNGILGRQPQQRDQTDLEVHVVGKVAQVHRHQGAEDTERQGQQHRERQGPFLVLCGQDQEDHDETRPQSQRAGATAALLLERRTAPVIAHVVGQHFGRRAFHGCNGLARAEARLGVTQNLDTGQGVEVLHRFRAGDKLHVGHRADLYHLTRLGADIERANIVRLGPVAALSLHQHLVDAATLVEIVHIVAAQCGLQGVVDVRHGDAQRASLFGVHRDKQLR